MAVQLWSPNGQCHIGLTSGHTFIIPGDPAGVDVPQTFRKEAIARGCLPVGMAPEEVAVPEFDRAQVIRTAMRAMIKSEDETLFTADGKPDLRRLNAKVGFTIERTERDRLWQEIEADPDESE